MQSNGSDQQTLETTDGNFPLDVYRLRTKDGELKILHVAAVLTLADETDFLLERKEQLPYGIALWSATVALAHDIVFRTADFRGKRVLELGSGTGMPGIAAAFLGAEKVVQTDRNRLVMSLCRRNAELNGIQTIDHRLADWAEWNESEQYDWIIGSDILYSAEMHSHLTRIFQTNLAPNGRVLLSDPFRKTSLDLMEKMEATGWAISISKWSVGEETESRAAGIFELIPPR